MKKVLSIKRFTITLAAFAFGLGIFLPAPASAATNPYTARGVCGSSYSILRQHTIRGAIVYLLYSNGYNCVVTIKTRDIGKANYVNAGLYIQGGAVRQDPGNYKYYAGPIKQYAAGKCIKYLGDTEYEGWISPGWTNCK